jgi:hypothetical protein
LKDRQFTAILGVDVGYRGLEMAAERLPLDRLPPNQPERIHLLHSLLLYRDPQFVGAGTGVCYTRTGRPFFNDLALEARFLHASSRLSPPPGCRWIWQATGYCSTAN